MHTPQQLSDNPNLAFPPPAGLEGEFDEAGKPEEFRMPPGLEPEPEVTEPVQDVPVQNDPVPSEPQPVVTEYPDDVDPAFKSLLNVFKDKGVRYSDVELVLHDAVTTGDATKVNMEALTALMDTTSANLIAASLGGVLASVKAAAQAEVSKLHTIAGGVDQFNAALAYAKQTNNANVLAGLESDKPAIQQLATERMMSLFKARPNQTHTPNLRHGNNDPVQRPQQVLEPLSQRQYAEELYAMRKSGEWDGVSYHNPKVKSLVSRLRSTAKAEAARTEAARRAAEAAMEAYYAQ